MAPIQSRWEVVATSFEHTAAKLKLAADLVRGITTRIPRSNGEALLVAIEDYYQALHSAGLSLTLAEDLALRIAGLLGSPDLRRNADLTGGPDAPS